MMRAAVKTYFINKKRSKKANYSTIAKKKGGGRRTIHHPSKQTKALQYALIEIFLNKLPIHSCAAAYRRNIKSPLLENATIHAKYSYSVRVDFSDFFHSISPLDLFNQISNNRITLKYLPDNKPIPIMVSQSAKMIIDISGVIKPNVNLLIVLVAI